MTLPPLLIVLLAVPVLLAGEGVVRRVTLLARMNIPAPVVGGLAVAVFVLALNLSGWIAINFASQVSTAWWTWLVTIEPEWAMRPAKSLSVPLLVVFFVCVGLNSTWAVVRKGSVQVVLFLGVATLLGVLQNFVGIGLAKLLGLHPLMGVLCGSLTMTGGHATTLGFAPLFEAGGLNNAAVIGAAMATMGLVVGSLMGGPVGGWLIRRNSLKSDAPPEFRAVATPVATPGVGHDLRGLRQHGAFVFKHLLLVLACVKAGAWVSYVLPKATALFIDGGVNFPIHIGAMIFATVVRNVVDVLAPGWIRTDVVAAIGSVFLAFFLTIAMMSLNLTELAHAALPMVIILAVQVVFMALFAVWVTFRIMGRDYEAAQMAAGHCGFGIGNTANAVASMKSLVERYGPAPRAFLVIPLVGGMLGDLTNAVNVTFFLKWLR